MNAPVTSGWESDSAKQAGWRIEKPEARRAQTAGFFPDQNGGAYEVLLSQLPVILHCMDGSGRMLAANQSWCQAFGYDAQDVVSRPFSEFLPAESRSRLVTEIYPKYLMTGMQSRGNPHYTEGRLACDRAFVNDCLSR